MAGKAINHWTFGQINYNEGEVFVPLVTLGTVEDLKSFTNDYLPKVINGFDCATDLCDLKDIYSKIDSINKCPASEDKSLESTIQAVVEQYNNSSIKWTLTRGSINGDHKAIYPKTRNSKGSVCNIVGINSYQDVIPDVVDGLFVNDIHKRCLLINVILGCVGNSLLLDDSMNKSIVAIDFQKTICKTNYSKIRLHEGWMIRLFTNRSSDIVEALQCPGGIIRNPRRKTNVNGHAVTSIYSK
jgi:hypothetical protein